MAKTEAGVTIDRPIEEVWKFVTNLSNTPKWDPNAIEMKQTSFGPLGVGSTIELRRRPYPHVQPFRVTEYEPNRKFSIDFTWAPVRGSKMCFGVETIEGKTTLNLKWDMGYHGFGKLIAPFVTHSAKRECATFVDNIKHVMESEARP